MFKINGIQYEMESNKYDTIHAIANGLLGDFNNFISHAQNKASNYELGVKEDEQEEIIFTPEELEMFEEQDDFLREIVGKECEKNFDKVVFIVTEVNFETGEYIATTNNGDVLQATNTQRSLGMFEIGSFIKFPDEFYEEIESNRR